MGRRYPSQRDGSWWGLDRLPKMACFSAFLAVFFRVLARRMLKIFCLKWILVDVEELGYFWKIVNTLLE